MKQILLCWLGMTDIKALSDPKSNGVGPIAQAIATNSFDELILLNDFNKSIGQNYIKWLNNRTRES